MLIGAVSDTHGTLPESIDAAFAGVELIVHAGDVGSQAVLVRLEAIAPVIAVRGNMDTGELEWRLPDTAAPRFGGHRLLIAHKKTAVAGGPPPGVDVVITGHTHRAAVERVGGVLFVNPGSAGGHNRDGRGPTAALLDLSAQPLTATIVDL
jgi:hypothetical protein